MRAVVERHPWTLLLVLFPCLAAVPFLAPHFGVTLYGDEAGYFDLADNLAHGSFLTGRDDAIGGGQHYPNLWFGPGLPLVLVPFVAVDAPVSVVRLVGPLCLLLAALSFYALLRLYVPPRTALVGAGALGLYVPFYTTLEYVHSEPLAVLLVVLSMYGTARYLRGGELRYLFVAGSALGWLALTRVAYGLVVTALLLLALAWWALKRHSPAVRCVAVCGVALAVCLPWLVYTYSVSGRPLNWGSSGGLSFYWMTSSYPGEYGSWLQAEEVFNDPRLEPHRTFFRSLEDRPLVDQNDALITEGFANIGDDPGGYARNVAANVSRMWFDCPHSFRQDRLTPLFFAVANGVVLSALLVSGILLVRRFRLLPAEAVPFAAFAIVAFVMHAFLSAYPRMLFPLIPVIAWFCTLALSTWVRIVPAASVMPTEPLRALGRDHRRDRAHGI